MITSARSTASFLCSMVACTAHSRWPKRGQWSTTEGASGWCLLLWWHHEWVQMVGLIARATVRWGDEVYEHDRYVVSVTYVKTVSAMYVWMYCDTALLLLLLLSYVRWWWTPASVWRRPCVGPGVGELGSTLCSVAQWADCKQETNKQQHVYKNNKHTNRHIMNKQQNMYVNKNNKQ